ncbi:MAG: uroporphyrinogen decarboxylase family protein [Bacillota bacterium]|nr:uroporphyrinogen decarboxylase family protein [Bacillota bacterium]
MTISSKQIILDVVNLKETPRTPVALLSGGAWTLNRKGLTLENALKIGPEKFAEIIEETNKIVQSDIVWIGSGYHNLAIAALGGKIKYREKGTPDILESLIKNVSDIETLNPSNIKEDENLKVLWQASSYLVNNIGQETLVGSSQWGPFTLAGLLYGVENLMRNIYKDKQVVHAVLEFATEVCYQYFESFIDAGVGILSIADPSASGDMISKSQFNEFSLPYIKKLINRIKERGVLVCVHICGNITNRLDLLAESGASFISLDYKVDLSVAAEVFKDKMAFSGNMNPVSIMQFSDTKGVKNACIDCIEKSGAKSNYIVMPGCDIPPAVPVENIIAMVETARNHINN